MRYNSTLGEYIEAESDDVSVDLESESGMSDSATSDGPKKQRMRADFTEAPNIYGCFNNWQPQPMIAIGKFSEGLNKEPTPDYIAELISIGKIRAKVTCLKDMSKRERGFYEERVAYHEQRFTEYRFWTKLIQNFIVYRQPHLAGVRHLKTVNTRNIFVAACFMDSGR